MIKLLVTCRPNTVSTHELKTRFAYDNQLTVRYFLPFRLEQVLDYLQEQLTWTKEMYLGYQKTLEEAQQLKTVLRNPFVLSLLVQSWETLSKEALPTLTRSQIYEHFVAHAMKKQELLSPTLREHLTGDAKGLLAGFHDFASKVAWEMFQEKTLILGQKTASKQLSSPWTGLEAQLTHDSRTQFQERQGMIDWEGRGGERRALLTESDYIVTMRKRCEQFEEGLPLKRRAFGYEFTHKSFFEYYAAKRILQLAEKEERKIVNAGLELLNTRPIQAEPEILGFLVEMWWDAKGQTLVEPFFQVIHTSRTDKTLSQAAANAATILNAARVSFMGRDLQGVQIPGADLSQAMLDNTCLHGANLQNVTLSKAFLRETDLTQADLTGAKFGEFPSIQCENSIVCVAFSQDGKFLAIGVGNTIELWEGDGSKKIATLEGHMGFVNCVAFEPKGERLASGSEDKTLRLWEVATGKTVATLEGHTSRVTCVAFDPKGERLVSGSEDQTLRLWEVATGKTVATLEGHTGFVTCVAFDPKGERLVSGSEDKTLRLWEVATGKPVATLEGHTGFVTCVAFDPKGERLVSGSEDKTLRLWEVATGKTVATLEGHTDSVYCVAFDPKGERLASGSWDTTVRFWEAATGKPVATLEGHTNWVTCVAFDPKGERLLSGSHDTTVRLWEADTGKTVATLEGHTDWVTCVAFDPKGQWLVSGSADETLRLWEAATGKPVATLEGHTGFVTCVAFDPKGERLVSGSADETLRLWEAATGKPVATLEGHTNWVTCVAFDPKGERLLSGSEDKTLRLWEVATGKTVATLEGHTGFVYLCSV